MSTKRKRSPKRVIKVISDEQVLELLSGHGHIMVNAAIAAQIMETTVGALEVQRCLKKSPIPYRKLGRKVRFTVADIRDYLNSSLRPQ